MMGAIRTAREDGIFHIEFNRPEKKNALTAPMYAAVRVLLIHGQAEAFTAGNDLGDFLADPPRDMDAPVMRFLRELPLATKPVVAAVAGPAMGIGTTLLLHCDYVVAAENARFALPFVNLGLCAEAASSLLLPLLVGQRRAAELLLLGEPFGAPQALELGIVNRVVSPEQCLPAALDVARKLAAKPPLALRTTKRLMKHPWHEAVREAVDREARTFLQLLDSPEAKEGLQAFLEKRPPDFSHF